MLTSVGSLDDELAGRSQMSLAGPFSPAYLWDNSPAHTDLADTVKKENK